jgi:hypothetical protein
MKAGGKVHSSPIYCTVQYYADFKIVVEDLVMTTFNTHS